MEWYRVAFGELYPLVYAHRDDAEAEQVAAAFAGVFRGAEAPVLDVACGGGRYTAAFGRAGVPTIGVDLSEFLLVEAVERRGLRDRVVLGDMRCLPFRDGCAAGAVNMFTSFGYFDDEGDNERAIAEIARILRPGGRFLMDFLNAEGIRRVSAETTRRREGGVDIEERREHDPSGRFLIKHVRVVPPDGEGVSYRERVRLYTAGELEAMLERAGLGVVGRWGDYAAAAFVAAASPRLILLAEKREAGAMG
ncbi:MAG TPA: class I SAM-dependent methyltransferase [Candidatus Krumholzibacteria bacterium]|nr:class I SAM-dependent methyltransferase [Candidatus Krumholzibacteria bacterium]